MREEILRMDRVTCVEYGITQLEDFSLRIYAGEIMGLMPLNNHGLTSLLALLQHNIALQYGYVYYREEQINSWRSYKPRHNRISIIQSESCLVDDLTVADNIFVLKPGFKSRIMRPAVLRRQLLPFLDSMGIAISADAYVEELTVFQRMVVELLKGVVAGCKLIILRDLGAHISESELKQLHEIIRHYAAEGIAFLYIDFHFEDMQPVCQRIALMSNGRMIKTLPVRQTTGEALVTYSAAYSHLVQSQQARWVDTASRPAPILEARDLQGQVINHLNFSVAPGECLVLQDVDNHIFGELLNILSGDVPYTGQLLLEGKPYCPNLGTDLAIIQELPTQTMLFTEMSYCDNLCFTVDHRLPELWRSKRIQRGIRREYAPILGQDVFDRRVDSLTEIQKYELVYHRIALQRPKAVFCVQPFRRADVELRMRIWELNKMLMDKGIAIIVLAVSLADALSLADRLIRIWRSGCQEEYERKDFAAVPVRAPWLDLYRKT